MPPPLYLGNCNYTAITTVGTTTVNQGGVNPGAMQGVFYGYNAVSTGTAAMGMTVYDIYVTVTGTGTVTSTGTLMNGTATAPGQVIPAGVQGIGIRYRGSLVFVTTGTAGAGNALWD